MLRKKFAKKQESKKKELVAPSAKITNIDSNGLVTVKFTKKMLIPAELKSMDEKGKV